MLKNYLKIGWRNLQRHKVYSFINIAGLAVGITVAVLNGLWIWDELSFNKYHSNYHHIAQVSETGIDSDNGEQWIGTTMTYPLSIELIENYPEHFKRIARTSGEYERILSQGEKMMSVKGYYADDTFPEMFTLNMIYGTRRGLQGMSSILISETVAHALFGKEDTIGQTVLLNNKSDVVVTGVYEDFPENTKFKGITFVAPWSLYLSENKWIEEHAATDLQNHFIRIYAELPEGSSFEAVAVNVKEALKFDPEDQEQAVKNKVELYLYPMARWHLYPPRYESKHYNPITMVVLVGVIGLFVLLLACINFMNLSTARSEKRMKEVGIRKTMGSVRAQLIKQFYTESFLIVSIAFCAALVLVKIFLSGFNEIAGKEIVMPLTNGWFWLGGLVFVLITSMLAGSYPALYLSSFSPVKVLKGTFRVGRFASLPRKVLVVFQFSISVTLIVATAVVYQQIQFAKDRPVGYDREGLITLRKRSSAFDGKYAVLRNELLNTGVVFEVSESMGPVTQVYSGNSGWDWEGRDPDTDPNFATLSVSHTHGKTVGWQFIAGRDFDLSVASDSSGLIINEAAAKLMGLKAPVGEPVSWTWWTADKKVLNYKILGVIKDMVMASPYDPIEPTMFYIKGHNGKPGWMNIKINPDVSAHEAIAKIETVFKKIVPTVPFEYTFVDDEYAAKFASESRIGTLAMVFAGLAIFISCLGLVGLASFVAEQRTREIGIRKVLGASVASLWKMLSKDFIVLVLIACLIAIPVVYYLMNKWLENFIYRTAIPPGVLVSTCAGAVLITLLTVGYQSIKAARMDPVKSLKSG